MKFLFGNVLLTNKEVDINMQRTHLWTTVCSGHNVPRETGVVHGEAQCDDLVPVHRRISTYEGSREFSHGPYVWVVDVISLSYDFITASLFILC